MDRQKILDPTWAWAPYHASADRPWTLALAAHLYRRAGFGANWGQLQKALKDGPQKTIDDLLNPRADVDSFNQTYNEYDQSVGRSESADELRAWWLRRMISTPFPLLEKMTLFWHGHFAVSNQVVKNAAFMQQYTQHVRSQAMGSFKTMLEGLCHNPAMLIGLDAIENRKSRPNEALARPLITHFTVGPDVATEEDIPQAASAFTGNFVRRGRFQFIEREHDDGQKTLFGQTGPFRDTDVIRVLLEQHATSEHIVRKLYAWLLNEVRPPEASLIEPLIHSFARDYHISKLVEAMLRSNLFFSASCHRQRIKCPVEFALGIVKGLEGMVSTTQLAADLTELGQNLYHPPTLKGWSGKQAWINEATLIQRANLANALLDTSEPYKGQLKIQTVLTKYDRDSNQSETQFLTDLFLQDSMALGASESTKQTLYSIVTRPEFHLA